MISILWAAGFVVFAAALVVVVVHFRREIARLHGLHGLLDTVDVPQPPPVVTQPVLEPETTEIPRANPSTVPDMPAVFSLPAVPPPPIRLSVVRTDTNDLEAVHQLPPIRVSPPPVPDGHLATTAARGIALPWLGRPSSGPARPVRADQLTDRIRREQAGQA